MSQQNDIQNIYNTQVGTWRTLCTAHVMWKNILHIKLPILVSFFCTLDIVSALSTGMLSSSEELMCALETTALLLQRRVRKSNTNSKMSYYVGKEPFLMFSILAKSCRTALPVENFKTAMIKQQRLQLNLSNSRCQTTSTA